MDKLALIKKFEGCVLTPYLDSVNIPTIGYGTTVYSTGKKVTMADPAISLAQAEKELAHHVAHSIDLKSCIKVPINANEEAALTSLVYNIGMGAFKQSTLLKYLNAGQTKLAVANEFLRWNKAGGKVLRGLTLRRRAERDLFLAPI